MFIWIGIDAAMVLCGGLSGVLLGKRMPAWLCEKMTLLCGLVSLAMGISAIPGGHSIAAMAISILLGTLLGELLHLEDRLNRGLNKLIQKSGIHSTADTGLLVSALVLFCFSSTGFIDAMQVALANDGSLLVAKSILDFFAACFLAVNLGPLVAGAALPQFALLSAIALLTGFLGGGVAPEVLANFRACGGVIMLVTGLRIIKLIDISPLNMLLSLVLVFPASAILK